MWAAYTIVNWKWFLRGICIMRTRRDLQNLTGTWYSWSWINAYNGKSWLKIFECYCISTSKAVILILYRHIFIVRPARAYTYSHIAKFCVKSIKSIINSFSFPIPWHPALNLSVPTSKMENHVLSISIYSWYTTLPIASAL